jgi:hypothetical protein
VLQSLVKLAGRLAKPGTLRSVAKEVLPGSLVTGGMATLSAGPVAGLAYGLGDFALNVPLVAGARKLFPGVKGTLTTEKGSIPYTAPSGPEQFVNLGASMVSPLAVDMVTQGRLFPQPTVQSQEQQLFQQLLQRQQVNDLQIQALAPGTMYQMQGMPSRLSQLPVPGIQLLPEQQQYLAEQTKYL